MSTIYALSNEHICIEVSSFGAELKSLKRQSDSREYMMQDLNSGKGLPLFFSPL